jgi:hypothetical protein
MNNTKDLGSAGGYAILRSERRCVSPPLIPAAEPSREVSRRRRTGPAEFYSITYRKPVLWVARTQELKKHTEVNQVMFRAQCLLQRTVVRPRIRHIRTMSSSKPFILFFNPVRHAKAYYESLREVARTEVVTSKSRDEFFEDVQGKYKDISVIYRTSASGDVCDVHIPPRPQVHWVLNRKQTGCW